MYINKVHLYGHLGADPELKALPSGNQVCSFSIATTNRYKKDGEQKEFTEWHNIVMFGKQAEIAHQYLKKGRPVYVEGRLQTRSWDDKDSGKKMYRTEIIVDTFQFGPSAGGDSSQSQGATFNGDASSEPKPTTQSQSGATEKVEYPDDDINPEDIPF